MTLCAAAFCLSLTACGGDEITGGLDSAAPSSPAPSSPETAEPSSTDGFVGKVSRAPATCEERCIKDTCEEEEIDGCTNVGFCLRDCDIKADKITNQELRLCNAQCLHNVTVAQLAGLAKSGLCMASKCVAEEACEAAQEATGGNLREVCDASEEAAHAAAVKVCEACVTGIAVDPKAREIWQCKHNCGLGHLPCRVACNGEASDRQVGQAVGAIIACAIPCAL